MAISESGEHGPAFKRSFELQEADAKAFVVIDSFLGGGGTGGVRMGESVVLEEVERLAREMTLKFAWLNISRGGAKSGIAIAANVSAEARTRILKEFGSHISDLLRSRQYIAGMDLGVGADELATIMAAAEMQQDSESAETPLDSNYFTALTVFVSLKTLLLARGRELEGTSVSVEGVGKVSSHLMRMIVGAGGRVVGVSTIVGSVYDSEGIDVEELLSGKETFGDDCVKHYRTLSLRPSTALYLCDADVLVPGARPDSVSDKNIDAIRAKYIVPIANISVSTRMEDLLFDRGVSYIPGFVSNSGGIFCWYLARLGAETRESIVRTGFAAKVRGLVEGADRGGVSIAALARSQAHDNGKRMASEGGSSAYRIVEALRKLSPKRSMYVVLRKVLGRGWAGRNSVFCRWYFDSRYFR